MGAKFQLFPWFQLASYLQFVQWRHWYNGWTNSNLCNFCCWCNRLVPQVQLCKSGIKCNWCKTAVSCPVSAPCFIGNQRLTWSPAGFNADDDDEEKGGDGGDAGDDDDGDGGDGGSPKTRAFTIPTKGLTFLPKTADAKQ